MAANILIVDDEKAIRNLLTRYLEAAGYTCFCAEDVVSAEKYLSSEVFDLLLCDLKMPGDSGLALLKHAKKHYPETGRIMITGFSSVETASEILAIGVYGYMIKPVTKDVVLITVENALRHMRLDLHMRAYRNELEQKISYRTEKITAIMNNLNVGVAMLDPELKILEVNRKMLEFFPDASSDKSRFCYQVFNALGCDEICEECCMETALKTGKSCEIMRRVTTALGKRDFRIVMSPIFDGTHRVYAVIALYDDITERLMLEKDLNQAQKLESVGQLAAGIAHEINSPIQYVGDNVRFLKDTFKDLVKALDGYESVLNKLAEEGAISNEISQQLQAIKEDADLQYLKEEIPQTIDQSLEGIHRVDKIVRAMKEYSHPSGDEKKEMDINKIIESTATVCRNEWKYVAELTMDLLPDLPAVPCFAGEISQVLLNIIVNGAHAISDFTNGGTEGLGTIAISTRKTSTDGVQIRISDSGGGIPEKIRARIFDPFFTTKARGKGTGQGLAIAHRVIVDHHQGSLSFESDIGRGTTFIIELPSK